MKEVYRVKKLVIGIMALLLIAACLVGLGGIRGRFSKRTRSFSYVKQGGKINWKENQILSITPRIAIVCIAYIKAGGKRVRLKNAVAAI